MFPFAHITKLLNCGLCSATTEDGPKINGAAKANIGEDEEVGDLQCYSWVFPV